MKKQILFGVVLFLTTQIMLAQTFEWAGSMNGTEWNFEIGYVVTVDATGNVITAGRFSGTVDFDPGSGTYNLTSAGGEDIFVSKLDAAGNFIWAKQMGGASDDQAISLAIDASGNVYTTGYFNSTADFDPGEGTYNLTSAGYNDIFVSKLDTDGNFVWAKQMGGSGNDLGYSIAGDASGNIYTTGYFRETVDFDPGEGTYNLTSVGKDDIFVSKLDAAGNFIWAKQMGGTEGDNGFSIAVDTDGNVYTTGAFKGTADFDPGSGTYNLTSTGGFYSDIFVSKLDASGNFIWAKQMGGTEGDDGFSIAVDTDGNVYTTGAFRGTADFDPGEGVFNLISAGGRSVFVSKLDAAGNFIWAKQMEGAGNDQANSLAIDASGNVYTTGYFQGSADFDPGEGTYWLSSYGENDVFVSKLDNAGNFVWAGQMGGTDPDVGNSIFVDTSGNLYTTGYFQGTADFDPGSGTYNMTSVSFAAVFVQKMYQYTTAEFDVSACYSYTVPSGDETYTESGTYYDTIPNMAGYDSLMTIHLTINYSTNEFDVTACYSYTVPSGDETYTESGTYFDTIPNMAGCDSLMTINLTINTVDVSVTENDPTLTANATDATFQWLDCDNGMAPVPGETAASFSATQNGNYAVEVTQNNCTDTSECYAVTTVGISENTLLNGFSVYPNPNDGTVYIDLGNLKKADIKVFDTAGRLVYQKENINTPVDQFELNTVPGIYILEINVNGAKRRIKLVRN